MKATTYLLIVILSYLLVWIIFGGIGAFCNQIALRDAMCSPYMAFPLLWLGWIPAACIIDDLEG